MGKPIVYGPRYSTFTRSVIMALLEKKVPHDVIHVERATDAKQPDHLARHPFGRVPAFEHNGFMIYETTPILRYIDDAFPGPRLTPADIHRRTRAEQIIAVINSYAYQRLVWDIYVRRVSEQPDEAAIAAALPPGKVALQALEDLATDPDPFLVGRQISLADLMLVPVMHYFAETPECARMLPQYPKLAAWHAALQARPSVRETVPVDD